MIKDMNVLVVGSSVIDLFIKADKDHYVNTENKVTFTLGDKVPVEIDTLTLGGNGANVSVGLQRLDIKTSFYTFLGRDILSQEIQQNLSKEGIDLLANTGEETSSLSLIFNFDSDRIIFSHHPIKQHGFEYISNIKPDYIYLTSVGKHWQECYKKVLEFSKQNNIPIAFSPGSNQMEEMDDVFSDTLSKSSYVFINREEAEKIVGNFMKKNEDIKQTLGSLKNLGPKIVSVTNGKNGAYCLDSNNSFYHIQALSDDASLIQKAGAGDAYASGFFASLLSGKNVMDAMAWGSFNAHSVMQHLGAQTGLLTTGQMEKIAAENPDYKGERI